MRSTAVRSWATDTGVKASSTRVIVAWSANLFRPHAAASAVSGRRRVLICLREAQSASILTTTSSSFSWGSWRTVLQPSWTCSHRGAKKSRCCRKYPSAAKGAYCVCRFIADRPSRFSILAYLRLEDLKPQVVCQFGGNFDSFDPPCFCAKFRSQARHRWLCHHAWGCALAVCRDLSQGSRKDHQNRHVEWSPGRTHQIDAHQTSRSGVPGQVLRRRGMDYGTAGTLTRQ